jgi:3-dehydroquinate dehydratase/shikimate dehydrogenase
MACNLHVQVPTIALAMGPKGLLSRVLAPKFGAFLTFGTLAAGKESAPGQPTLTDLTETCHLDHQSKGTKVSASVTRHSFAGTRAGVW